MRADEVERAGLGADDPGVAETAERERAESVGVSRGDQPVLGQEGERVGAADLRDRLADRLFDRRGSRSCIQVQDDFGVAAGLEDGPVEHQLVAQLERVDEIAVVRHGNLAVRAVDEERLRVLELAFAGGRIARVPDSDVTGERLQRLLVERFGDVAHGAGDPELDAVGRGDAGALLPAVLERVKAEVSEVGGLGMAEDSEDAALVFKGHFPRASGARLVCLACVQLAASRRSPPARGLVAAPATLAASVVPLILRCSSREETPERVRPHLLSFRDRAVDGRTPRDGHSQSAPPVTPIARAGTPSSRPTQQLGRFPALHRYDGARGRLAKQRRRRARRRGRSTSNPMPSVSNAHSARVIATPPSEQSWADCSSPAAAARVKDAMSARSVSRSSSAAGPGRGRG